MKILTVEEIKKKLNNQEYDFLRTDEHLGENIILLGLGGSYAYGTNIESSDVDCRGVALNSKKEILFNPIAPNSTKRTNFSKDRFFLSTSLNFRNKQIDDFLQQKIPIMKRKKKLNSTILSTQRVTSPLFRMLTALSKDIDK